MRGKVSKGQSFIARTADLDRLSATGTGESFESHHWFREPGSCLLVCPRGSLSPKYSAGGNPLPHSASHPVLRGEEACPQDPCHPHLQLHCHHLPLWAPMTTSPGGLDVTHPTPTTSLSRQDTLLHHTCGNRMFSDNTVGCLLQGPVHSRPSADTDSGRHLGLRVPRAWDSTVMILMKRLHPARRPIPRPSYE